MPEIARPPPFPLIRHLSRPVSLLLVRLPVSANAVTTASLAVGLGSGYLLLTADGAEASGVWAGLLLCGAYILDNCDGEVARAKGQTSEFGRRYDDFTDWVVHTWFFIALGLAWRSASGADMWAWMGAAAAAGATINYALAVFFAERDADADRHPSPGDDRPQTPWQWTVYAFRELARADFCFLVLGLGLAGSQWLLLPAAAIGAQVYWLMQFSRAARRFHP